MIDGLRETDIGTRKLLTMHGVFHCKSSIARLYTSRKEGGKCLHSIKNVVHQAEQGLKSIVGLIAAWKEPDEAAACAIVPREENIQDKELKKLTNISH